eukprot:8973298-Pyramimonas_sp.AAC.1
MASIATQPPAVQMWTCSVASYSAKCVSCAFCRPTRAPRHRFALEGDASLVTSSAQGSLNQAPGVCFGTLA